MATLRTSACRLSVCTSSRGECDERQAQGVAPHTKTLQADGQKSHAAAAAVYNSEWFRTRLSPLLRSKAGQVKLWGLPKMCPYRRTRLLKFSGFKSSFIITVLALVADLVSLERTPSCFFGRTPSYIIKRHHREKKSMVKRGTLASAGGPRPSTETGIARAETIGPDGGQRIWKPGPDAAAGPTGAQESAPILFPSGSMHSGNSGGSRGGGPRAPPGRGDS